MCDAVRLPDGKVLHSLGELRTAGYDVRPEDSLDDDGDHRPDEACFCGPADIDAILERPNAHWVRDLGPDFGDWVVVADAATAERLAAEWHQPAGRAP